METYKITVTNTATYIIESEDVKKAEYLALEYFYGKKPNIKSEKTNKHPEYTIFPTKLVGGEECIVLKRERK